LGRLPERSGVSRRVRHGEHEEVLDVEFVAELARSRA
jgi:hypothetical protein